MPKVVDHAARRRELAAAVWRVILRRGIEGVSIRDVAAESGWSTGALRHYFATKDELLAFAARLVAERVIARLGVGAGADTPRAAVRATLAELLPLDAERRAESAVWFAFVVRRRADPRFADEQGVAFAGMRALCARILGQLAADGHFAPGRDPDREAARLHALLDGLTLQALLDDLAPDDLLAILDTHLAELVPGGDGPLHPPLRWGT